MLPLKSLSKDSLPKAITRAKHYRLLNEPWQAESICRDILEVDPGNQQALRYLVLAITDQFGGAKRSAYSEAMELCAQLTDEYQKHYYRGIVEERMGKSALNRNNPRIKYIAYEHYHRAMKMFEEAEKLHPEGNPDAILRWNACVRGIQKFKLKPSPDDIGAQPMLDI